MVNPIVRRAGGEGVQVTVGTSIGDLESNGASNKAETVTGVKRKAEDDTPLDEFRKTKSYLVSFLSGVISALDDTPVDQIASFDEVAANNIELKTLQNRAATPPLSAAQPLTHDAGSDVATDPSATQASHPPSTVNINIGSLSTSDAQAASEKIPSSLVALRTRLNAIQEEVDVRKATTSIVKLKSSVLSSRVKQLSESPAELKEYHAVLASYEARLQDLLFDYGLISHEVSAAKAELSSLDSAVLQCERECSSLRSDKAYLKELLAIRNDQSRAQGRHIAEQEEKLRYIRQEHEREIWKLQDEHAAQINGFKKGQATLQRKLKDMEDHIKKIAKAPNGSSNRPLIKDSQAS